MVSALWARIGEPFDLSVAGFRKKIGVNSDVEED